jgi:hypothetical protein
MHGTSLLVVSLYPIKFEKAIPMPFLTGQLYSGYTLFGASVCYNKSKQIIRQNEKEPGR